MADRAAVVAGQQAFRYEHADAATVGARQLDRPTDEAVMVHQAVLDVTEPRGPLAGLWRLPIQDANAATDEDAADATSDIVVTRLSFGDC